MFVTSVEVEILGEFVDCIKLDAEKGDLENVFKDFSHRISTRK